MMVASRTSARRCRNVTVGDHFDRVAAAYESLRTTDQAPVGTIRQFLPDRPVTGLDIGCGTGRYSRLLRGLLPDGSLLVGSDVSTAMLAQFKNATHGQALGVVPVVSTAEELPLRTASLDLVTAFAARAARHGPAASPASRARLPGPGVSWTAEPLLLGVGGSRRDQVEPDSPGSPASQAIKDEPLQISAGHAGWAPDRRLAGRATRSSPTARSW